ncbi:uncharacterized protein LOC101779748 [Setaria italica]|uniref:Uncharacterized protein n=1 Tax=Setaria italica TaxID=4555 RepID=K4AI72_SETIT|nr:uncharacterized protein LOC101779748 [Setaria italica]
MAADRVLLSRDDRTTSLVEIASATATPGAAATVGFRILVVQCYRAGVLGDADEDDDDVDTMEDVACRVPVDELVKGGEAAAAAVDRAFEALVSRLDHPTLIPEVAPEARKAATQVQAMCAEREIGAALAGVEFRLRLVFLDPLEDESEPDSEDDEEEEVGSDLEFDDECWERGRLDDGDTGYEDAHVVPSDDDGALVQSQPDGGAWRYEHGHAALNDDDDDEDGGGQFSARPFDGALAREVEPSDGTLLLSGFEARADGPEPGEQHELTPRDVRRLVRLAFSGGDVEGDEAYQRALASGEPVSPATRAAMLDRALRSAGRRPLAPSPSGMPPRMRTGW